VSLRNANFLKKTPVSGGRALIGHDRTRGPHLFSAHTPPKERGRRHAGEEKYWAKRFKAASRLGGRCASSPRSTGEYFE